MLLSDRIEYLTFDADSIYAAIKKLAKEVQKIDGVESIEHLADVPRELVLAQNLAEQLYNALRSAETYARLGGC